MLKSTKNQIFGFSQTRFTSSPHRKSLNPQRLRPRPLSPAQLEWTLSNLVLGSRHGLLWLLILSLPLSGCVAYPPIHTSQIAVSESALPDEFLHYYDYEAVPHSATIVQEKSEKHYLLRQVEFPLQLPADLAHSDLDKIKKEDAELYARDQKTALDQKLRYTNRIDFYLPKNLKPGERRPAILISPILGGNMVVDRFAAYYTGRGYVAAIVHRKRLRWDEGKDMTQVENYIRTSVIRLRQALDWMLEQPEVDRDRIGAFGVSYGAILHTILAAVEPRIRYHVLAMPAAPLADVMLHCPEKQIVKLFDKIHEVYGWNDQEIYAKLQSVIKSDPIKIAPHVPRHKVQVYIALFDRVVGTERSFHLWKQLGKPELKVIPFGHYGGVIVFPLLQSQSYRAFKKHLR